MFNHPHLISVASAFVYVIFPGCSVMPCTTPISVCRFFCFSACTFDITQCRTSAFALFSPPSTPWILMWSSHCYGFCADDSKIALMPRHLNWTPSIFLLESLEYFCLSVSLPSQSYGGLNGNSHLSLTSPTHFPFLGNLWGRWVSTWLRE